MAGIELEGDNDDAANLANELLAEPPGVKYLGFSPLVPSKREKNVLLLLSFAQFCSVFIYFFREVCLLINF